MRLLVSLATACLILILAIVARPSAEEANGSRQLPELWTDDYVNSSAGCVPGNSSYSCKTEEQPDIVPARHEVFRNQPEKLVGKRVRPTFIIGCYAYKEVDICVPTVPSIPLVMIANRSSDPQLRRVIDRCRNVVSSRGCRPEGLTIVVRSYDTDPTGLTRIIYGELR